MARIEDEGSSTVELVRRLQAGGERKEDFEILFRRYYRLVRHVFLQRGVEPQECDDLTQETFLAVHRALPGFRHEASFETWLLQIARNVLVRCLRREQTHKRSGEMIAIEEITEAGLPAGAEEAPEAWERVFRAEQRAILQALIQELPGQMRLCARLRFCDELSHREIASALDISIDAVKVQLHRARKRLHELMLSRKHLSDLG